MELEWVKSDGVANEAAISILSFDYRCTSPLLPICFVCFSFLFLFFKRGISFLFPVFATFFSASVFGVSPKSMQCSFDERGNSVPTILVMMQKQLYSGGGLKVYILFSRVNTL